MNLKPLQDWAVIRRSDAEEKTPGGIIIPEVAKEKPLQGVIVAIGPGRYMPEKGKEKEKKKKFVPTVLKPGQRVIYQKYAEREIELGSEVVTLVREEDILGTVEDYAVTEKKTHALEGKREGSVEVRNKAHVPAVMPARASEERPATEEKKSPAKKPAAEKRTSKTPPSKKEKQAVKKSKVVKKPAAKKPVKKTVRKKTAKKAPPVKKKVQSPAKKSPTVKKTVKKAIAKKRAAVKAVPKKTAKPTPKKTAVKKSAVKKTVKKTPAKTKGRKK